MYRLIYPTEDVSLAEIARAALAHCGPEGVTVVSGTGSQAVRVPEDCADRVEFYAGLAETAEADAPDEGVGDTGEEDPPHPPPSATRTPEGESGAASGPDGTSVQSPGPDVSNKPAPADDETPGRPAGRAADRPVKRGSRRKEG